MFIDIGPLKRNRDFRLLFIGQVVSFLGSMITYVAIPYQIYDLTKSNLMVGLLGTVQLVPVLVFGLLGGSVADTMDRRKLLLISEAVMSVGCLALMINASLGAPSVTFIFVVAAIVQSANAFHRPAMEAMTQKMVAVEDLASVSALGALRHSAGAVAGPALGGVLIAFGGARVAYFIDFLTFLIALVTIALISRMPPPAEAKTPGLESMLEGVRYALRRPELIGTYVVDIVAMTFAFSIALFPAMGESWGGATQVGILYSAMSAGALIVTLFSGWTTGVDRRGAAVVLAAGLWGVAMILFGVTDIFWAAVIFLAMAGAADQVSGIFRGVIWNETIPNEMRGRMAGIEMISYMTGPLIGNARAGWMANATSTRISIVSGGILCVIGVVICAFLLPRFWKYRARPQPQSESAS